MSGFIKIVAFLAILISAASVYFIGQNISKGTSSESSTSAENRILIQSTSICDEVIRTTILQPVTKFEGQPAKVNFDSNPSLKEYFTVITEGAKTAPNLAGHFSLIEWGCGTSCLQYAIVDSNTGNIVLYPGVIENLQPDYSVDSRLLVMNPKKIIFAVRR